MGRERTLLERLGDPPAAQGRSVETDTNQIIASVVGHLRHMLNCRQGVAPAHREFGLPDLSEIVYSIPGSIPQVQRSIKAAIEKFEPRLTGVNVVQIESEDDLLTLRFQITAQVVSPDSKRRAPICLDTTVDGSGRVNVS